MKDNKGKLKDNEIEDDKEKEKSKIDNKEISKSKDKEKKKEKINENRLYELTLDNKEFAIKVEVDKNFLKFNAQEINEVFDYAYKNKFELNQIVKKLNLHKSKYTSFAKLLKFIDTAYLKDKIYLEQKTEDDLFITFEVPIDFEEEKYSLHLKKRKLPDSEVLPMLMEQINRLNNNNAIVKKKFNEIERQINTISRKSSVKQSFGSGNISKEIKIIKKQLNDINGKLFGTKKVNNSYNARNTMDNKLLRASKNKKSIQDFNSNINISKQNFKSNFEGKRNNNLFFYNESNKNKKYNNNYRYEDKNENEKEESSDMYINDNNKIRIRESESNKKRTKQRILQREMNEIKISSKFTNNNEEQKYDDNEIQNLRGTKNIRIKKEQKGMIINFDENNIDNYNSEENNNIGDELDDSYNNNNNIKLHGRRRISISSNSNMDNNIPKKENAPKIIYVNKNPSELEEYKQKTKFEYTSAPVQLKYIKDICRNNTSCGWNDMFEVYISYKDNKEYLASPNNKKFSIDIYSLEENQKEASLKGHNNNIRTIRYFFNKDKNEKEPENDLVQEYLLSADDNKIVIVWDILNNFEIKQLIDTNYEDDIYSCSLFFNKNTQRNYIVTSTYSTSSDITNSATKLYSLATGEYAYYIKESNFDNIYYLLIWYNKKDKQNYLIQFSYKKILINNVEKGKDELYAKLIHEPENEHYCGYIFPKENSELLCTTCYNGFVHIWDLYTKKLVNIIDTKIILCYILPWNERYSIAADFENNSFVIIDLDEKKVYNGPKNEHNMEVKCVKKIRLSKYGESLITAGRDHVIKLWSI